MECHGLTMFRKLKINYLDTTLLLASLEWPQLRRELKRCRSMLEEDSPETMDALSKWFEQTECLVQQVLDAVERAYAPLISLQDQREFALQVKDHPLAALLFRRRSGRLNQEILRRICSNPLKLFQTAQSVGLEIPPPPIGPT